MNEFDAYEMDEQCDEDNNDADLGSSLHDEVYSKGLATLAASATLQSTPLDRQGNIIEPPSHLRPAKMIEDILDKDSPAKTIEDILGNHDAAKLIDKFLRRAELRKLLESLGSDVRTPAQIESRQHEPSGPIEDFFRKLNPLEIQQPGIKIPLAKKN